MMRLRTQTRGKQLTIIRSLLILVAICFSTTAFAQSAPPKAGNKPTVRVKPKEPTACKLVGTVRGTRLWAGLRGSRAAQGPDPARSEGVKKAAPAGRALRRGRSPLFPA